MPRPIWSGSISFGLVNVPVALVSGKRDLDPHFRQINEDTMHPIEVRRYCSAEDVEVPYEEIVRGYEVDGGWVTVTDEELEALAPEKTKTIDVDSFVELDEIRPIHFDRPYFLVPTGGEGGARAYQLLRAAIEEEGKTGIGRLVLRTKEYLVALRARDGALAVSTLRFPEEVRPIEEIAEQVDGRKDAPTKKEIDEAVQLIESMGADFDPTNYEDEHRRRLERIIAEKGEGREIEIPEQAEEPEPAPDLMAALEKSLADVRRENGKGRKPKRATGKTRDREKAGR